MARKLDHMLRVTKKESYGVVSLDSFTSREFKPNFVPLNSNYLKSPPFFSTFISTIPHCNMAVRFYILFCIFILLIIIYLNI